MVNLQRTFEWLGDESDESITKTLAAHASGAIHCGRFGGKTYVRVQIAADLNLQTVTALREIPSNCEIFVITTPSESLTVRLSQQLSGRGGMAGIRELRVVGRELGVILDADPLTFFAFVDLLAEPADFRRRAVLPLCDATLCRIAGVVWNAPTLQPERILEVAAQGDTC